MEKADAQGKDKAIGAEVKKQSIFPFSFSFPFNRKKLGLLEKLAGELDAGQRNTVLGKLCRA